MNVTLSYPNFPYGVTFPHHLIEDMFFPDDEAQKLITPGAWLIDRDGGPLLITQLSDNPSQPFEKPIAAFEDTCCFNPFSIWDLGTRSHIEVGGDDDELYVGYVKFNFADKDTALLFKMTFGGAA